MGQKVKESRSVLILIADHQLQILLLRFRLALEYEAILEFSSGLNLVRKVDDLRLVERKEVRYRQ